MMLITVLENDCMLSGYATLISFSSAGARSRPPHRTRQQFSFFTRFWISFLEKEISMRTLTHSPVAAGVVMALENVLGILMPSEAINGMMIIVVSFPGTPQMQCLSATTPSRCSISPEWAIALVIRYRS